MNKGRAPTSPSTQVLGAENITQHVLKFRYYVHIVESSRAQEPSSLLSVATPSAAKLLAQPQHAQLQRTDSFFAPRYAPCTNK